MRNICNENTKNTCFYALNKVLYNLVYSEYNFIYYINGVKSALGGKTAVKGIDYEEHDP